MLCLHRGATAAELATKMPTGQENWPHRRLAELVSLGYAERGPYRLCTITRQRCLTWRAIVPEKQLF